MKVFVLVCSGSAGGNTEQLAGSFAAGCRAAGHEVREICMSGTRVEPCSGCNACRAQGACVNKDGMQEITEALLWCDLIAFATPLYFWGMSAQMKLVIDRMYALGKDHPKGYFAYPRKQCVLLSTCADSEKRFWVFESLRQYYQRLMAYLRWEDKGMLLAGNCGGTKVPRCIGETGALESAFAFGKNLL